MDYIDFKLGTFMDFKGNERLIVACSVSEPVEKGLNAQWEGVDGSEVALLRAFKVGIAVYNSTDEFNLEVGKEHALQKANNSYPILFTTTGSVISKEVSIALLNQAIANFAKNPESVIPGYKETAAKYAKIKESENFINYTDDNNVDTVLQMIKDGVDVKALVDKISPYANALKNDSSLVD